MPDVQRPGGGIHQGAVMTPDELRETEERLYHGLDGYYWPDLGKLTAALRAARAERDAVQQSVTAAVNSEGKLLLTWLRANTGVNASTVSEMVLLLKADKEGAQSALACAWKDRDGLTASLASAQAERDRLARELEEAKAALTTAGNETRGVRDLLFEARRENEELRGLLREAWVHVQAWKTPTWPEFAARIHAALKEGA